MLIQSGVSGVGGWLGVPVGSYWFFWFLGLSLTFFFLMGQSWWVFFQNEFTLPSKSSLFSLGESGVKCPNGDELGVVRSTGFFISIKLDHLSHRRLPSSLTCLRAVVRYRTSPTFDFVRIVPRAFILGRFLFRLGFASSAHPPLVEGSPLNYSWPHYVWWCHVDQVCWTWRFRFLWVVLELFNPAILAGLIIQLGPSVAYNFTNWFFFRGLTFFSSADFFTVVGTLSKEFATPNAFPFLAREKNLTREPEVVGSYFLALVTSSDECESLLICMTSMSSGASQSWRLYRLLSFFLLLLRCVSDWTWRNVRFKFDVIQFSLNEKLLRRCPWMELYGWGLLLGYFHSQFWRNIIARQISFCTFSDIRLLVFNIPSFWLDPYHNFSDDTDRTPKSFNKLS